jgi:hypothetical protein
VISWAAFTLMFTWLRTLAHWIRGGHGLRGKIRTSQARASKALWAVDEDSLSGATIA